MKWKAKQTISILQLTCIVLCAALLLCGCTPPASTPPASTPAETEPSQEPLDILKGWLEKDCSFAISLHYMDIAINGMSQETVQTFAADGSWVMTNHRKTWNYTSDYEFEEDAEFYYRYEDSQLICYSRIGDEAPQRGVMNEQGKAELAASREVMLGVPGLLPEYLQALSVTEADGAAVFTFRLPAEKVMADSTYLSVYVNNAFYLSGKQYKTEYDAAILCTITADPETFQPRTVSFDFSELKPYVLSSGALSGEYALGVDLMVMTYAFDYDFPETTDIPQHMIP